MRVCVCVCVHVRACACARVCLCPDLSLPLTLSLSQVPPGVSNPYLSSNSFFALLESTFARAETTHTTAPIVPDTAHHLQSVQNTLAHTGTGNGSTCGWGGKGGWESIADFHIDVEAVVIRRGDAGRLFICV